MSHTFGKMATALVGVARTHRAEDYTVTPTMEVTIPEIGLKLTFEREEDGGIVLVVRGHAGILPPGAPASEGDMLQILPVAGNTVGIRLRGAVR